jgi:hypothetical protein
LEGNLINQQARGSFKVELDEVRVVPGASRRSYQSYILAVFYHGLVMILYLHVMITLSEILFFDFDVEKEEEKER